MPTRRIRLKTNRTDQLRANAGDFLDPNSAVLCLWCSGGRSSPGAHVAVGDVGDFVICVGVVMWAEVQGNPHLLALGTDSSINMEGKESRFGVLVK